MTRTARVTAAVGIAVVAVAAAGTSGLIAALDGPLWAVFVVIALGAGALAGLARGLAGCGQEPPWREREGRRDGYVHDCNEYDELAEGFADLAVDGHIDNPQVRGTRSFGDLFDDRERWQP